MVERYVSHRYFIVKADHETLYVPESKTGKEILFTFEISWLARMDVDGPRYEPKHQKLTTLLAVTTVLRRMSVLLDVPVVLNFIFGEWYL